MLNISDISLHYSSIFLSKTKIKSRFLLKLIKYYFFNNNENTLKKKRPGTLSMILVNGNITKNMRGVGMRPRKAKAGLEHGKDYE